MLSSLLSPCEVKLHLLQSAIYLVPPQLPPGSRPPSPSRAINQPPATNDVLIRGLIELYVPSDRRITGLKVKLRAVQTVAVLDPLTGTQPVNWEETVLLEKRLVIPDASLLPPSRPSSPTRQPEASSGGPASGERSSSRNPITSVSLLGSLRNRSLSRQPRSASQARAPADPVHPRGRQTARTADLIAASSNPASAASSRTASPSGDPSSEAPPYSEVPLTSNGVSSSVTSAASSHPNHPEHPEFGVPPSPSHSRPPPSSATPASKRSSSVGFFGSLRPGSRSRSRAPPSSRRPTGGLFGSGSAAANQPNGDELDDLEDVPDDEDEQDYREGRSRHARGRGVRAVSAAPTHTSNGATGAGSTSAGQAILASPSGRGGRGAGAIGSGAASRASSLGPSVAANSSAAAHSGSSHHEGLELSRGVHGFEFAFILPSDSPPYERSPYGRVRYIIKATAVGAGRARSDVSAWRDVFPIVNPSVDGGPTPLQVLYNDIHPTVGLLSISCTSNSISVGGIFNVDIASPLPPPDLTVYLVRISLETHIELFVHTKTGPGAHGKKKRERQVVPPQRRKLFERGYVPPRASDPHGSMGDGKKSDGFIRDADALGPADLEAVARGGNPQSWEINAVARMPDDNAIRPSTAAGTRADVRFSHVLIVEIVHSRAPEEDGSGGGASSATPGNAGRSAASTPGVHTDNGHGGGQTSPSPFANLHPSGFFEFGPPAGGSSGGGATGQGTSAAAAAAASGSARGRSVSKGKSKERDASTTSRLAPGRKIKVFTLRQPITLPSCCVAFDSVQLPPYTLPNSPGDGAGAGAGAGGNGEGRPVDLPYDYGVSHLGEPGAPTQAMPRPRGWQSTSEREFGPAHDHCVCGQSLEDLRQAERALEEVWPAERSRAIRAGWGEGGEGVRRHGKIGEYVAAAAAPESSVPSSPLAGGANGGGGETGRRASVASTSSAGSRSASRTRGRSVSHSHSHSRSRSRSRSGGVVAVGNGPMELGMMPASSSSSSGSIMGRPLRRLSASSSSSVRSGLVEGRGFSVGGRAGREREGSFSSLSRATSAQRLASSSSASAPGQQRRGSAASVLVPASVSEAGPSAGAATGEAGSTTTTASNGDAPPAYEERQG
ncbi:hypothetical protein OC834_006072 [Tilletia horrida]|nr:hypothetical protein OC834_006072 [Tilletia horrida]